jgi:hypothetical protein
MSTIYNKYTMRYDLALCLANHRKCRGAIVGLLTTLVVAEAEALYDEVGALQAGQCQ